MFDFDFSKLLLIGVVALIFIPPKDLPAAMRTVGQLIGKARRMAAEFQGQFNEAIREAELDGLKEDFNKLKQSASLEAQMAHVRDVASAVAATAPITAASLESSAAQGAGTVEPLPAAISVETPMVAEAAQDLVMGPLAPPEPLSTPAAAVETLPEKSIAAQSPPSA